MRKKIMEYSIGIDEAGRGCLAGPVVAAAVLFPGNFDFSLLPDLNDSKKISCRQREHLQPLIKQYSLSWGIGYAWPREIDSINILQATFRAMSRAVKALYSNAKEPIPQKIPLAVDGNHSIPTHQWRYVSHLEYPKQYAIIGGDALHLHIAAASVLAKTHRDFLMERLAIRYPQYQLAAHKGYGTKIHLDAIKENGPCRLHRLSFRGVKQDPIQGSLLQLD